ncbi:MAG: prepilin-type N-terminal cleavage/methylation domain-containing protein [Candidatus Aureabacteria bacterium]|nr:prepilin-type N-terminal cleavage/methylation domain-containing protein [Candidatus Auribacterota bacterium]
MITKIGRIFTTLKNVIGSGRGPRRLKTVRHLSLPGFTLIELMIVMAVIAILVGIILPSFKGMKDEAQYSKVLGDLRTLQTAVESFSIHNNQQFPEMGPDWQNQLLNSSPKLIDKVMLDPFSPTNSPYQYVVTGPYYVVWSVGLEKNGKILSINPQTGKVIQQGKPIWVSNSDEQ